MKYVAAICLNGAILVLTWAGFLHDIEGARNVVGFVAWAVACIAATGLTEAGIKGRASLPKTPAAVRSVLRFFQLSTLVLLVWVGAWLVAIPFGLAILLIVAGVVRADELRAKLQQAQGAEA